MFPRGFQSLTLLLLFLLLDHCSPSITSHISDLLPVKNLHFFDPGFFYLLWLDCRSWDSKNLTSIYHYDLSYMGHFPFFKLSKLSKPQSQYWNVSQKGRKGQITATSIHQQSLLTSRICKHALCSNLGGPSRREPRSRKTSRFWKHVQWGSGVAARPHISTVIWTAT